MRVTRAMLPAGFLFTRAICACCAQTVRALLRSAAVSWTLLAGRLTLRPRATPPCSTQLPFCSATCVTRAVSLAPFALVARLGPLGYRKCAPSRPRLVPWLGSSPVGPALMLSPLGDPCRLAFGGVCRAFFASGIAGPAAGRRSSGACSRCC